MDTTGKLNIFWHDGHPLGVNGTQAEDKFDQLEQDALLDSLIFYGVKPNPNVELRENLNGVITQIMGLQDFKEMDLLKVNRFRMPANQTENVKIAPVLVKFSSLDTARKVFAAKNDYSTVDDIYSIVYCR
ncbi:hypothetical protein QYM36_010667 [Artemia franciscana]|uniref:Uncharacterized protein n=1 Tax=Artemia franciscana TaxID=6661 RepID=A0AA88HUR1_ARTSF|nr:hypothetical protein QYM36_010667 [Artemia franciscana]